MQNTDHKPKVTSNLKGTAILKGPCKTMRLQKYLAHAGVCSRRKAEEHILKGRVKVNELIVTELGTKIDADHDQISFDNKIIFLEKKF